MPEMLPVGLPVSSNVKERQLQCIADDPCCLDSIIAMYVCLILHYTGQ